MKKSNTNKKLSAKTFLDHTKGLTKNHEDYLGLNIPEGYFSKSKNEIIASLPKVEERKKSVFRLKPLIAYPIAASIVFLIGITIWLQNPNSEINTQITDIEKTETIDFNFPADDFLVYSLLVEDSEIDQFVDDYIINEMIVKADLSERELESLFLNSLLIEDSLIDNYLEKNLIENIIL